MDSAYCYPNSAVLRNKLGIRDAKRLQIFETEITVQRLMEGVPTVDLTPEGYRKIHNHIFQDVYDWAGQYRTVNLAKGKSTFCRAEYISPQIDKRFGAIIADRDIKTSAAKFAERTAEHLSELNAIHPFREGNGRTLRAFLEQLGEWAGFPVTSERIGPGAWIGASERGFLTADTLPMRIVIADAIIDNQDRADAYGAAKAIELERNLQEARRRRQKSPEP
jgi:cell filamentation protein